jgi:hypothetical protein
MSIHATPFGHVEIPEVDPPRRRPPGRRGDGSRLRRFLGRPDGNRHREA